MSNTFSLVCAVLLLSSAAGAGAQQQLDQVEKPLGGKPAVAAPTSVEFLIQPTSSTQGATQFLATYSAQGKVAKFRVELARGSVTKSGFKFTFGNGAIVAEPGSDATAFLAELMKALEAKHMPKNVKRVSRLAFSYVILGENQSRDPDGGFSSKPPGQWTAMKITFESRNPDDECEVFLNFSLADGKAEFSEKDVDYGDPVLAKLATVL
jgi:hypothetical protein